MAQTIEKGITITFRGDTTKFEDSVKKVNSELKGCKNELSLLNKELKLDPTNFDKLSQKMDALKEKEKLLKEEVDNYKKAMEQLDPSSQAFKEAEDKCRELEVQIKNTANQIEKMGSNKIGLAFNTLGTKLDNVGSKFTELGKKMSGVSMLATGVLAGAVKEASDFESKMSQVQATMGILDDSTTELNGELVNTKDALSDLAREMGSKTAFSAGEASEALNYLALAGYDVQKMADTLPVVLNLASAGGIDLASASDMVTDAMSALGMEVSDATTIVDQMAKTSSSSNTSVAQLGEAILSIGATAKSMAGGTTELNTALGILANSGIKGAEAGTKLRNIILSLQNPTDKAKKSMKELGVNVYDSEGNMRGLNDILGDLNASMESLTDEEKSNVISNIFNKADLASAQALLASTGDEWENLTSKIEESAGSAQQMADTQLNNLSGQVTILKSGISELAISMGESLIPTIQKAIEFVQGIIDKFNDLNTDQKEKIVTLLAILAGVSPLLIVIGTTVSALGKVISSMSAIVKVASSVWQVLNAVLLSNPIALVIAGIAALIAIIVLCIKHWDDIAATVSKVWEKFKELEWVQALIGWFDKLIDKISSVVDWFKTLFGWIGDTISKVGDFFSSGFEKIGDFVGGLFESGGFGNRAYASGGYGSLELNTTINVNNNGGNLSQYQAKQFGRQIVEYVNDQLGRRL